ncbi:MAG: hypothetical protein LBT74_06835 [Acidobacteriota bacterium]|nr:hypothetical protein [Acidobacteriota bacterium]
MEGLAGLLERIGKKEQEALAELYDRTGRLLFGLASKVLDDAEAAAQALLDTYTHIWRHSPASTAPDAPVQPLDWLVKTARTYAVARLVSSRRRRQPPATPSLDAPGTVAPAEQKVARFQLEALAPMQREVLNWAYFSGLSADEIAGRIGTPVGAVRAHVRMGLNRLGKTPEIHEPATGDEGAAS